MYNVSSARKIFGLIALFVFTDQIVKFAIRHFGGFYVCNKNLAFGIKIPDLLFWIFSAGVITVLIYLLYKKRFIYNTLCLMLILSGAFSNMIDRYYFGCVIDFIDLKFWPVFNLADVFITVGGIMIILEILKMKYKK
jgi:signal peptidase II